MFHEKNAHEVLQKYASSHEEYDRAKQTTENIARIKKHRHWGQPWVRHWGYVDLIV